MNTAGLQDRLIDAAKNNQGGELAMGLISLLITPAIIFIRGDVPPGDEEASHEDAVFDALDVRDKCKAFAKVAEEKLLGGVDPETGAAFRDSVAIACLAQVNLLLTVRACGGNPVAANGMIGMAVQAMFKDLKLPD